MQFSFKVRELEHMNTFERSASAPESPANPEELKTRLSELYLRKQELTELIAQTGENIDVELGSPEYIDHGYTAELREVIEPEIAKLEEQLAALDDQNASQRNLNI